MVSIIISESCFYIFVCVVLYVFIDLLVLVVFFYSLMELMVLEEYRSGVSLSLLSAVLCSLYRLCFYQLSSYFNSLLHGFYIQFYTLFFIICKYFYTKTGCYKYNIGGTFFSTVFSYSILPSSFTAVFLEHCLVNENEKC